MVEGWVTKWLLFGWLVVPPSVACVFFWGGRVEICFFFVWSFPENWGEMMQLQFEVYCLFIFPLKWVETT